MRFRKRYLLAFLAIALPLIAYLDYTAFCKRAADMTAPETAIADGVIAPTGGSGYRIRAGVELVQSGAAPRMLISGINPEVSSEELITLYPGFETVFTCCVELGYAAETTVGNAIEAADWAKRHNHQTIIIVTSEFHMQRSLILFEHTMPDLDFIAYPVSSRLWPDQPFKTRRTFRALTSEWIKWRLTRALYGKARTPIS